jgi:thiol-disulfide isomerase/thioredoxin
VRRIHCNPGPQGRAATRAPARVRGVVRAALVVAAIVAATSRAQAGGAPDFRAASLEGDTLQLASFRGQVVIIDFWASWCPPCREQLERLAGLEKDVPGLVVLAVNVDTRRDKVERYVRRAQMPRRVLLDPSGVIASHYGVQGMPWTVLLDGHGQVVSARGGWGAAELPKLASEVRRLQGRGQGD